MVNAPQVFNPSNHGMVGSISLIVMFASYALLFMVFPHFREKAKEFISSNKKADATEVPVEEVDVRKSRKEIDNFDLSFFED